MTDIQANIRALQQQIAGLAETCGRNPADISLLAVSKTFPASSIREAWLAGQRTFGENYVDEALDKIDTLTDLDIEWHFIGRIQSNKTRKIAGNFSWAHCVASEKVAQRLNDQRPPDLPPLNICIQVNIDNEPGKSGVTAEEALELAGRINHLPQLRLRGIMGIPEKTPDREKQRQSFHALAQIFRQIRASGIALDTLSMGMTADMEEAIAEGATMLRIGTAIFGQRNQANNQIHQESTK